MNIYKSFKVLKSVILASGMSIIYGCVNTMSKGNLNPDTMPKETFDMPIQETASSGPDLMNLASLAIIILIVGFLFWKKGCACGKGTGNKE